MVKGEEATKKASTLFKKVAKRDGSIAPFDITHISDAVMKAMKETGEGDAFDAHRVAEKVVVELSKTHIKNKNYVPGVEEIQDSVERELMWEDFATTAKAYILYRQKRAEERAAGRAVPDHVKKLTEESSKYFRNQLAEFVFYRTYARWIDEEGRRETWIETVDRYMDFMKENMGKKLIEKDYTRVREAILKQEAMPSMRLLQFAGPAARRTHVCAYNCSYIAPMRPEDFGESMYVLMCGAGLGFSVESKFVQQLPQIKEQTGKKLSTFVVPDTKEGWADALVHGMKAWYDGTDVEFDLSQLRPAGARLKVMGGRSSGPEPLRNVLDFTRAKMLKKQGRRLSNIDVHDIMCKIGEVVVAGGVRRSALISLSDLDDADMRDAKKGQFYYTEPQRVMSNNSAVYTQKPSNEEFMDEWVALMKSGSGERGIFNREALKHTLPKRRLDFLKGDVGSLGSNPCGEIILQPHQFCNLSEMVARAEDTEATLLEKARVATILGMYQAMLTDFGYLSNTWKKNCEGERLLGVSLTGQWDSPVARKPEVLKKLRAEVIKTNKIYAEKWGIKPSTCVTSVKPSGTVSQLVDSASGMHPRHAQYYIRRVRIASNDPLFKMMKDQGVPFQPEVGQSRDEANTYVLEFPIKAPKSSHFKDDITAIEQLEYWKRVKINYTEHNPSVTISVGDDEWIAVANWVYENWDIVGGLAFLPRDNHVYQLAPYETITKERYEQLAANLGTIDFSKIVLYEKDDTTEAKKELACAGGVCEIV
ncbi:MAG: ribonucleoside-triphosphate reductase [Candidatus Yonathbacteria bacterium]|nr:ribonucleoside-triphosphate reductase [Candidatus Yonathbacteria bacterium]